MDGTSVSSPGRKGKGIFPETDGGDRKKREADPSGSASPKKEILYLYWWRSKILGIPSYSQGLPTEYRTWLKSTVTILVSVVEPM